MIVKGKEVLVGGGIVRRVQGTVYMLTCEVLRVDESDQTVEIKEGWLRAEDIVDVMSPGAYAIDNAINVIGADKDDNT
jgi:hypothetical protein